VQSDEVYARGLTFEDFFTQTSGDIAGLYLNSTVRRIRLVVNKRADIMKRARRGYKNKLNAAPNKKRVKMLISFETLSKAKVGCPACGYGSVHEFFEFQTMPFNVQFKQSK